MDNILKSPATVKNILGWTFSPLPKVGSQVGDLNNTPGASDLASQNGCKSQSFTSWDCVSRLYVGGAVVSTVEPQGVATTRLSPVEDGDIPTQEELTAMSASERYFYKKGMRKYYRGKGVLTEHQYQTWKRKRAPAQGVQTRAQASGSDAAPGSAVAEDVNEGFYYSDMIPVRSAAVSSMTAPRETDPMPWTPVFQALATRLNDPAQTGVLAAVVRSPNVRDCTTMSSLVKSVMLRPSTRYELAAMVRVLAMQLSVSEETYAVDPIPLRFIRNADQVRPDSVDIFSKPGVVPQEWKIVAMPLDTFVALANNTYFASAAPGFSYTELDVSWTAVPFPSDIIGQTFAVPYIMSFLSSEAWSGTVNYHVNTTRQGPVHKYGMAETYMPVVNNVDIPGVKKIALVLIDETSLNRQETLRIGYGPASVNVPIWYGTNEVAPPSWWNVWSQFWRTENIDGIRRDTTLAHNKICARLGVDDACGTAVSLAAEMYGQWYQGVAPQHHERDPYTDYSQPAHGAWTLDGSPLDKTSMMKSSLFSLDEADKRSARRRCVAYNFTGISPLHLAPTSLVRIRYINEGGILRISWSTQGPECSNPSYNIQTMSSVMRVATAMGLLYTHTDSYVFGSPRGMTHWIHMLANALSFSMSSFFAINDTSPRDWIGLDNRYDVGFRASIVSQMKSAFFSDLIVHHDVENLFGNIPEWDMDIAEDYWLLSPYGNVQWMTYSPVPFHCTWQWIEKLDLSSMGTAPRNPTHFRYLGANYTALKIQSAALEHKLNSVSTIDLYRRNVTILVRETDDTYKPLLHWVDNVSYYSSRLLRQNSTVRQPEMYESLTACLAETNLGIDYSDGNTWYVLDSLYNMGDPKWERTRVSPIQWPDPPLLDTLWQGAKNYILKPAASALAGFLTGGPAGAAVAGATHIAHQLVTDLSTEKTGTKAREAVTRAEHAAKSVLGLNPTPLVPKTQPTVKQSVKKEGETGGEARTEGMKTHTPVVPPQEPMKALETADESPVND
ncbi:capsid protein [Camponotus nipponicus virus]|uniref:Capsid protein n=1 Tax=Camponotus nipponicus virus TaxID=1765754 RepID=A0A140JSW4_9VIRU|nr:capsid protein [Camponotus nipponicus virus]BAU58961.1 capsid protein [Camponotus nipponicus virus]